MADIDQQLEAFHQLMSEEVREFNHLDEEKGVSAVTA